MYKLLSPAGAIKVVHRAQTGYQIILDFFSIVLMDVLKQDVPHLDINKP